MDTLRLAWRNLWRNRRRTLVTMAATAFALLTMIVYSGLISGYLADMKETVVEMELGDIQIHAADYREKPSLYERIEDPEALRVELESGGYRAAPRLLGSGLGAAGDSSAGISMRGIEVELDRAVSEVSTRVERGQWLRPDGDHEVVLGGRLARILGLDVGGELVVLSQAADGSTANDVYTVRGILAGVSDAVDRGGVYMRAEDFRELMVFPEGAHQLLVRIPDGAPLSAATEAIRGSHPDLDVQSWRELMPTMAQMLDSTEGMMVMMFLIVYVAIGIVVLNATLMAVFERIREFGVLKAIGVGPRGVLALIFTETTMQTLMSVALGVTLALPLNRYLSTVGLDLRSSMGDVAVVGVSFDPIWTSKVDASTYLTPVVTLVLIITLAVLYPAFRAAYIRPVDAMRHR